MISFASSIWLWTAAGIAIPVIIHLWNVRKGRSKKIGSILFFTETAVSRARSLQVSDLFLLLVRCLLFAMIAMFLARPLMSALAPTKQSGWLLMERSYLGPLYKAYGREIDSLLNSGFELHEFGGQFGGISLSDSNREDQGDRDYWQLLRKLEKKVPAGLPVCIYSGNRLNAVKGERPVVSLDLQHWRTVMEDSQAVWIQSAYLSDDDSVMLVIGKSMGQGPSLHSLSLPMSAITIRNGRPSVEYGGDAAQVDTSTLHVAVYADAGTNDGVYLASAIEAAREQSARKIKLSRIRDFNEALYPDWLFWLSSREIPSQVKAINTFTYANGSSLNVHTAFKPPPASAPVKVYKMYPSGNDDSARTWRTGTGQTIMAFNTGEKRYKFYSRLDPSWNEWVWQDGFPQFVLGLLFEQPGAGKIDNRVIDEEQLMPGLIKERTANKTFVSNDLSPWFWFIAFGLFLGERLLVYRRQKKIHG